MAFSSKLTAMQNWMRKGTFCCQLFSFFNLVFFLPNHSLFVIYENFVNEIGKMWERKDD